MNTPDNTPNPRLACVFPGQGSQAVGMLNALAAAFPAIGETFAAASAVLGYDLWKLVSTGPAEELNHTERTQPAMLAAGVAVWRVWTEQGGRLPAVMAGHSLGEYTALVCAGALEFEDAVALVADRGRFMRAAVPEGQGAMAAILGLDDAQVIDLCAAAAGADVLSAVNFNSPGQVVVAGHAAAVQRLTDEAKQAGAKRAVVLPVSVPSHCALMQDAARRLAERLGETEIHAPRIPVIHNIDATTHEIPADIASALTQQLYSPVRWTESVRRMAADGVTRLIECGPGKVLSGLNRRITRAMTALPVYDPPTLEEALRGSSGG